MKGDIYFRWSLSTDTDWDDSFAVYEENVLSLAVEEKEGSFAKLTITVKNPRAMSGNALGLLAPSRRQWVWLAWDSGSTDGTVPLFFGQLVGIPSDLTGEKITLVLLAKPADYLASKQALAETLKKFPGYDPVFTDAAHRDNPDAIIAGYSAFYHCDRITHVVTLSDYVDGDGDPIEFGAGNAIYSSVAISLGQVPLRSVSVDANISYTQRDEGQIDLGMRTFESYSGDGFLTDWPKPLADLGSGWSVVSSFAHDVYGISTTQTISYSYSWSNHAKEHEDGDTMSVSESLNKPALTGPFFHAMLTSGGQTVAGHPDAFFVDETTADDGSPIYHVEVTPGQAASSSAQYTDVYVPLFVITAGLKVKYVAARTRHERVKFTLRSDVQPVLSTSETQPSTDSTPPDNEVINISGADVSLPLQTQGKLSSTGINVADGDTVTIGAKPYTFQTTLTDADGHVQRGANAVASMTSLARAIEHDGVPGTDYALSMTANGDTSAQLSDDGLSITVSSASGSAMVTTTTAASLSWTASFLITGMQAILASTGGSPPAGMAVKIGSRTYTFKSFQDNSEGAVTSLSDLFNAINGTGGAAGTVANPDVLATELTSNTITVTGTTLNFVPVSVTMAQYRGEWQPYTAYGLDDVVTYGGATYQCVFNHADDATFMLTSRGGVDLWHARGGLQWDHSELYPNNPEAIPIGDWRRRSYFPIDRGLRSLEHLIARARARLRIRSRCVQVSWKCPFEFAVGLSCRKSATLFDSRFPGGQATGKISAYSFMLDGNSGEFSGKVTILCAVGNGGVVADVAGDPDYVDDDYVEDDYQVHTGDAVALASADVSYETPIDVPNDDGLTFPLGSGQAIITDKVIGTKEDQLKEAQKAYVPSTHLNPFGAPVAIIDQQQAHEAQTRAFAEALVKEPLWWELELRAATGGPFSTEYAIDLSTLAIPKQVDLAAVG